MSDLFSHFVASGGLKLSKLLPPTPNKIKISISYQVLRFGAGTHIHPSSAPPWFDQETVKLLV